MRPLLSFGDIKLNEVTQEEGVQETEADVGMEWAPVRAEDLAVLKAWEKWREGG